MSDPPVFSWWTVNASVENSPIAIQVQVFTYSSDNAIQIMTDFMEDVNALSEGFSAMVTVDGGP